MASNPPAGMSMLMKSFGIDPAMFSQVAKAVTDIAGALRRIEEKQDKILKYLEGNNGGSGKSSA